MKSKKSLITIIMAVSMLLITIAPGMALASENSDTTGITMMLQLPVGETCKLIFNPINNTTQPYYPVWESSDTSVATVNYVGVVTGVGEGIATITSAGLTYQIHVGEQLMINVDGLFYDTWNDGLGVMLPGSTAQASAYTSPSYAPREVTWHSSNPEIATIDENGFITASGLSDFNWSLEPITTITATTAHGLIAEFVIWVGWPN